MLDVASNVAYGDRSLKGRDPVCSFYCGAQARAQAGDVLSPPPPQIILAMGPMAI